MNKIILNILIIILLGIIQVSFLTTWPFPVNSFNLILSLVVFLVVIVNYHQALWLAFGAGLFLEIYSSSFFGVIVISLLILAMAVNFLFNNFFTNRSSYSLIILGILGTLIYNLLTTAMDFLVNLFRGEDLLWYYNIWPKLFWQPIFNAIILLVIFYVYYLSTDRLTTSLFFSSNSYEKRS
ncbi:MAG: hypothetical protein RB292_00920 [Patescibacteria group bacterium]|jgi:cell shape-determining protein MreD|nr:hypothetical protein [Patescibacteria group bacterium]